MTKKVLIVLLIVIALGFAYYKWFATPEESGGTSTSSSSSSSTSNSSGSSSSSSNSGSSSSSSTSTSTSESAVVYKNTVYGFNFSLPASWQGYTIVNSTWDGFANGGSGTATVHGPLISIRNPAWTKTDPHQDIPIMVFTLAQWNDLQADKFHIGAAPIGPSELGKNTKYVFALPARYNYAFPTGYQEVDQILATHPLVAF